MTVSYASLNSIHQTFIEHLSQVLHHTGMLRRLKIKNKLDVPCSQKVYSFIDEKHKCLEIYNRGEMMANDRKKIFFKQCLGIIK